jgi:hypothetical protein
MIIEKLHYTNVDPSSSYERDGGGWCAVAYVVVVVVWYVQE